MQATVFPCLGQTGMEGSIQPHEALEVPPLDHLLGAVQEFLQGRQVFPCMPLSGPAGHTGVIYPAILHQLLQGNLAGLEHQLLGSTTSKCVLLEDGVRIVGKSLVPSGIGTDGPEEAFRAVLTDSRVPEEAVARKMATGYGRNRWQKADGERSELTAHALGCHFWMPEARTVIDIGGQDAKVITLDARGQMEGFVMNDKCAAGTGRFLDVMAGILKRKVGELGALRRSQSTR